MNVRIISGRFGGRKISAPEGKTTHPMSERIRNALFNSLGDNVQDAVVLDAFAGTGSVGIEALSRGAKSVVFIERDRVASKILQENIELLDIADETKAVRASVSAWVGNNEDAKFDLIFADPPYHDVQRGTIRTVSKLLAPGGKMLISLPEKYDYTQLIENGFVFENERIYGNAKIVSLVREKA